MRDIRRAIQSPGGRLDVDSAIRHELLLAGLLWLAFLTWQTIIGGP